MVAHERPLEILQNPIGSLISPLGFAGLVVIVVLFMLLEREGLRDRFIRLVGYGDLHRTTEALQDAGQAGRAVSNYAADREHRLRHPIAIGLWILSIPNALLWGVLALALRFVPYIGPVIGALLPLFLALAVAPGWSLVLWTPGLFVVMELVTGNVIVAAIFWTWLWGPLGLILSTPLTVCLVVLGRHVPQFEFPDVLFGNEPALEPHARLYQRLLAGDPDEATDHAEEMLEEDYLVDFCDKVAIPALLLGEQDRVRGVMANNKGVTSRPTHRRVSQASTTTRARKPMKTRNRPTAPREKSRRKNGTTIPNCLTGPGCRCSVPAAAANSTMPPPQCWRKCWKCKERPPRRPALPTSKRPTFAASNSVLLTQW